MPVPAPRFRSFVACLRLCLRSVKRALTSRGTALAAFFCLLYLPVGYGVAFFPAGISFVPYWLSPARTKQAQKGGLEVPQPATPTTTIPFPPHERTYASTLGGNQPVSTPPPPPLLHHKPPPFRLLSGDGDGRGRRVRGAALHASVPFRRRLFAFVLQTSKLRFTWHRPRCNFVSFFLFPPSSHWRG